MSGGARLALDGRPWNGSKWIRPERRVRIYARDGYRCVWCRKHAREGAALSIDHFLPVALGGSNETENLLTCCLKCNSSRQDTPALTYAIQRDGLLFSGAWEVLDRVLEALSRPLPVFVP